MLIFHKQDKYGKNASGVDRGRFLSYEIFTMTIAGVVELVDAEDSKSSARKGVRVQVSPPAPSQNPFAAIFIHIRICQFL